MVITYEEVTPTPIANTVVKKLMADGVHRQYCIYPVEGYVIHDTRLDSPTPDGEDIILGYTGDMKSVGATYDFVANPFNIYAVPRDTVPEDQIFGGGNNNHEIM